MRTSKEIKKSIDRFATDVEKKAHSYALIGKDKMGSTLKKGRKLIHEKKVDLVSTIEKEKNRLARWY